jgi:putative flippase GtrA
MDPLTRSTAIACLVAAIIPFVIPWRYVFTHYGKMRGDRWR